MTNRLFFFALCSILFITACSHPKQPTTDNDAKVVYGDWADITNDHTDGRQQSAQYIVCATQQCDAGPNAKPRFMRGGIPPAK